MAKVGCVLSEDSVDLLGQMFRAIGDLGRLISPSDAHLVPAALRMRDAMAAFGASQRIDCVLFEWITGQLDPDAEGSPTVRHA